MLLVGVPQMEQFVFFGMFFLTVFFFSDLLANEDTGYLGQSEVVVIPATIDTMLK